MEVPLEQGLKHIAITQESFDISVGQSGSSTRTRIETNMPRGKAKGSAFERQIFKDLGLYFSILAEFPIRRTLGSGASDDDADLQFLGGNLIEVKHWKRFNEADLQGFWGKVEKQATAKGLNPVLIYKENYCPIKVMFFMEGWRVVMDYEDWKRYMEEVLSGSK